MLSTMNLRVSLCVPITLCALATSGCGHVVKAAPKLQKILSSTKSAGKQFGDDVVKYADDGASRSKTVMPNVVHAPRLILMLKKRYDSAQEDQSNEEKLFSAKRDRLHQDDKAIMEQRIEEHRTIFYQIGQALNNPSELSEDAPKEIASFLSEFQADSKKIQSLLSTL